MKLSAAREIGIARLRSAKVARASFRMSRRPNAPREGSPMSKHEAARHEGSCRITFRVVEAANRRLMIDESAVMQKDDVLGKPSCLAHVMGHDDDFDAAVLGADKQPLDVERRSGIEAGSRLIE